MTSDFEVDRSVIRRVMAQLDDSMTRLARTRAAIVPLDPASFGTSGLGQEVERQAAGASDSLDDTVRALAQVHDQLVQALVELEHQADLADEEAAAAAAAVVADVEGVTVAGTGPAS